MKKAISILLAARMLLSLCACGTGEALAEKYVELLNQVKN